MRRKQKIRTIIGWAVVALLAAGLALMPKLARRAAEQNGVSVLSASAGRGDIEYTLAGGGTLTAEDPVEVKIPETVEVSEYLVKNGDHVEEGQPLAKVDRVTLLEAITEVQDSLDELAKQMREEGSSSSVRTLYTQSRGRIKAVYAEIGDDVRQVMLKHGALAVVSLDGRMTTEIETSVPVPAGAPLQIRLSDGKTVTGRVESVLEDRLIVTLSDDGPLLDDIVTAFTDSGKEVGSGVLKVHSPWNVMATDGTVQEVYVRENQLITSGNGILRLQGLSGSASYQALASKRAAYEDLMTDLFRLYTDDTVRAPAAGFISGIDDSKIKNTAAAVEKAEVRLLASEPEDWVNTLMDAVNDPPPASEAGSWIGTVTEVTDLTTVTVRVVPYSGDEAQLGNIATLAVVMQQLLANGEEKTFSNCESTIGLLPGYPVMIVSDGERTAVVPVDLSQLIPGGMSGEAVSGIINMIGGMMGGGMGGMMSGDMAALLAGLGAQNPAEDDGLYEREEKTILSVTPDDAMTVSIDVDELDILQYRVGMQADVTVDALPDREFSAEVTDISALGRNSGGNSKYEVKLRLDRAPDMLDGMSASVVIHGGSRTALLLPVAAVYDHGSRSYVYSDLDSKSGEPARETPVTTGLSDGENVEILSGIEEGHTVFYEYYTGAA